MTTPFPLSVHRSPFAMRYPFTVIYEAQWLRVNGKYMVNGQWKMVNDAGGAM